ncbi:methyltransferase domain-containing protein [Nonomuraea sp. MCN248]|uniref:Methyltransferase domain-containing protein n=1 Tax=Nonomuraea corallina TaxID=2989783 RepID=A0ABT4S9X2_9ACTN|nr:methyltransferase domain-containing protein [Nonomuraea corallina]MDA0633997.1 methyltransferase domain-containing protein [Nonomuraea corallina]
MDWQTWHDDYDLSGSPLARRLRVVQERIEAALDACAPGPVKAISLCAGQGRDLLGVLAAHPRRADVRARLVELDPRNAAAARQAAAAAGLDQVEVLTADAAFTDCYQGMAPADLVLACGIFGNITDEDIERTVDACSQLCATGGTVIWTRHRDAPDVVPLICDWFGDRGFELSWLSDPEAGFGVGAHRFTGHPKPLALGERLFTFVDRDTLREPRAEP